MKLSVRSPVETKTAINRTLKLCSVEECGRRHYALGLCSIHGGQNKKQAHYESYRKFTAMIDVRALLNRWNNKLDTTPVHSEREQQLVTSRRAFLGLLGAGAAYAASHSPAIAALEVFEEIPAVLPVGPREGFLEVMIGDNQWVSLGRVIHLQVERPRDFDSVSIFNSPFAKSIPARQMPPRLSFELVSNDFGLTAATMREWQDKLFGGRRLSAEEYKKTMRFSNFGVDTVFNGCFPTEINYEIRSDSYNTVSLEISTDYYEFKSETA